MKKQTAPSEAEKFITLFEKIFVEETAETDCEDGLAGNIVTKIVSKIKDKIDATIAKKNGCKNPKADIWHSGNN